MPDYMHTASRTSQWDRPMKGWSTQQHAPSVGGPSRRPQVDDVPKRRGSNASSSVHSHASSTADDPSHHRDAASVSTVAAGPTAADSPAPPLGSAPTAPSYNTAVFLSNNREAAAAAPAAGSGARNGGGSAAAGAQVGAPLPPNWERRTDKNNKTCEHNHSCVSRVPWTELEL